MQIVNVDAFQILDSRGIPTVECRLTLTDGTMVAASVPSGASTGKHEAHELRDHDATVYGGKGVLTAVKHIKQAIAPVVLLGKTPDIIAMDKQLIALDGTRDCSALGANAMLAVSIAVIRAQAWMEGVELFEFINALWQFPDPELPRCMFNVINGGMHAQGDLVFQEFLAIPTQHDFAQSLACVDDFYHKLQELLHEAGLGTAIGDEGGFVPVFTDKGALAEEQALMLLQRTAEQFSWGVESMSFGLDVAATHFYDARANRYRLHDKLLTAPELIEFYKSLAQRFALVSLEDGLAEDDWQGWQWLMEQMGGLQLIGDDLLITNTNRIQQGITKKAMNAVLIKPNQIGTVSRTVDAIRLCQEHNLATIISHRSGETNDDFIADLAVGTVAGQLKAGAPVRGERVAKYNRLLWIAELLSS
jgi:enolase